MHPKNSTTLLAKQAPLLTRVQEFHEAYSAGECFFSVSSGIPVGDALNEASAILGAAESVSSKLQDDGLDANGVYCIRLMIKAAQALINAGIVSVEHAGCQEGFQ
ncbi:hypothetical protein BFW86_24480 [Pseudomonas fluorescens]|nr:hypothetical protein BFW86_24480 [Pseudomonas fluorescens]